MRSSRGYTMFEILVVLVILAVLAGLATPRYFSIIEQGRVNEARANLNIIYMGQKIYRTNNATYWNPGNTTIAAANTTLGVDMTARYYTTINVQGAANSYTAILTRNNTDGGAGTHWVQHAYVTGTVTGPVETSGGAF